ncbi:MAG: toprim domain-containing protein [Holosporales bacterium]|jgi:DNA primase|nr:toprim domain-containing protein [Holosporales bacterium]
MQNNDLNRILDAIRSRVSIAEIIGKDVSLKRKGREFVGNCPFHNEKTGSFFVNDEKGKYYCFGCGAHGDIFSYIMQSKGHSFKQVLEVLADMTGVKLPKYELKQNNEKHFKQMREYNVFFKDELSRSNVVKEYCDIRGIHSDLIEKFSIGYCPENSSKITKEISKFKGRIIFPIFNNNGTSVIGFGGRSLQEGIQPKYINSSESEDFQKKEILYGYHIASKNISKNEPSYIVVEGYMDVITMHKFGFNTTVGSMGTSFTSDQLFRLWKYCDEPILCFDGDTAGCNAMVRAAFLTLEYISPGKTLKFCNLPKNNDPDSYLKENSRESMVKLLEKSVYLIDFVWERFLDLYYRIGSKNPEHVSKWKLECISKLNSVNNEELKKMYILDIKNRIYMLFRSKGNVKFDAVNIDKTNKKILREAILLYTLARHPSIVPYVFEKMALISFSNSSFEAMSRSILIGDNSLSLGDLKKLENIAGKYCLIDDSVSDKEAIEFWDEIFSNHFFHNEFVKDIEEAKHELKDEFNESAWERLKALKLNILKYRKNT